MDIRSIRAVLVTAVTTSKHVDILQVVRAVFSRLSDYYLLSRISKAHMLFPARWARKLSWKETAETFRTSWDRVSDAVEFVVGWGLEHRTLESIRAIGVDEIQYAKGHK